MGIVNEETRFEDVAASIMIVERTKGEYVEPWRIITLEVDGYERITPKEMRKLGRWLIAEGKRIGQQYKSNGARKEAKGE